MEKIHAPAGYTMKVDGSSVNPFWVTGYKYITDEKCVFICGPHMPTEAEAIAEWNAIFEGSES